MTRKIRKQLANTIIRFAKWVMPPVTLAEHEANIKKAMALPENRHIVKADRMKELMDLLLKGQD